jgi:hypothetical protein
MIELVNGGSGVSTCILLWVRGTAQRTRGYLGASRRDANIGAVSEVAWPARFRLRWGGVELECLRMMDCVALVGADGAQGNTRADHWDGAGWKKPKICGVCDDRKAVLSPGRVPESDLIG